jgi:hypothetical protein
VVLPRDSHQNLCPQATPRPTPQATPRAARAILRCRECKWIQSVSKFSDNQKRIATKGRLARCIDCVAKSREEFLRQQDLPRGSIPKTCHLCSHDFSETQESSSLEDLRTLKKARKCCEGCLNIVHRHLFFVRRESRREESPPTPKKIIAVRDDSIGMKNGGGRRIENY